MVGRGNLAYAFGSPGPDIAVHLVVRGASCVSGAAATGEAGAGGDGAGCAGVPPASSADNRTGAAGSAQQPGSASQSADPSWLLHRGNQALPSAVEPLQKTFQRRQACGSEANHDQLAPALGARPQESGGGSLPPQQGGSVAAGLPNSEGDECAGAQATGAGAAVPSLQQQQQEQHVSPGIVPGQHQSHSNQPALAHSQSHTALQPPPPPPGPGEDATAAAEAATADAIEADPAPQVAEGQAGQGKADDVDDADEDDVVFVGCTPGATPHVSQDAAAWLRGAAKPRGSQRTPAPGAGAAGPSGRSEASALKQQRSILHFVRPSGTQGRAGGKATRAGGRAMFGGGRSGGRTGLAGLGAWGGSQPPSALLGSPARLTSGRAGGMWEQDGLSQPPLNAPAHQQPPRPDAPVPAPRPPSAGGSLFGSQLGRAASAPLGAAAASHGRQRVSGGAQGSTGRLGRQGSGTVAGAAGAAVAAAARISLGACQLDDTDSDGDDVAEEETSSRQPERLQPAGAADRAGDGTAGGTAAAAGGAGAGTAVAAAERNALRCVADLNILPASCVVPDSCAGLLTQDATLAGTCEDVAGVGAAAEAGAAAPEQLGALGIAGGSEEAVVPATPLSVQGSERPASGLAGASAPAEGPLSVRSAGTGLRAGAHAADARAGAGGAGCLAGVNMVAATPLPPVPLQHPTAITSTPLQGAAAAAAAVVAIAATPEHAMCGASVVAGLLPAQRSGEMTPAPDAPLLTAALSTMPATAAAAGPVPTAPSLRSADRTARVLHRGRAPPTCAAGLNGAPAGPGHDELLHPGLVLEVHVGIGGAQVYGGGGGGTAGGNGWGAGRQPAWAEGCNYISCLVQEPPPGAGPDAVTPDGAAGSGPVAGADASGDKNNACAAAAAGPPAEPAECGEPSTSRPHVPDDNTTPRPTAHQRRRLQSLPSVAGAAAATAAASAARPARRLLMLYTWVLPPGQPPQLHSVLPLSAPGTALHTSATPGIPATPSPLTAVKTAAGCGSGGSAGGGGGPPAPGVGHALTLLVGGDGSPALLLASQLSCAAAPSDARRSPSAEPAGNNGSSTGAGTAVALRSPLPTAGGCGSASGSKANHGVQLLQYSAGSWRTSCVLQPPQLEVHAAARGTSGGSSCPPGVSAAAASMLCVSAAACVARGRQGGGAGVFWQVVAAGEGGHGCVWRLPAGLTGAPLQQAKLPQARYKHSLPLNDVVELSPLPDRAHLVLGASSDGCVVLWDVGRPHAVCGAGAGGAGGTGSAGVVLSAVAPPAVLLTVARPVDGVLRGLQPLGVPGDRLGGAAGTRPGAAAQEGEEEAGAGDQDASFAARTAGQPVVFLAAATAPSCASGSGHRQPHAQCAAGCRVMPVLLRDGVVDVGQALHVPDATCVAAGSGLGAVGTSGGRVVVWNPLAVSDGPSTSDRQHAKQALLDLVKNTNRGLGVRTFTRGLIEEAQIRVESYQGDALDFSILGGKWKLIYTTASDVLPILEAEYQLSPGPFSAFGFPRPLEVGNIYQRFTSPVDDEGIVENIINIKTPASTLVFTVGARYDVRSGKRIALVFEDARLGDIQLSDGAEALLAPALLPRGSLQHQLLLAIKEFTLKFQFRTAAQLASQAVTRAGSAAAGYLLTYLDKDMLIGRAIGLGGVFVFVREE
ncbi:hypothetical protein HXX76_001650 [Chlamydomonas incerta]|uniref:Plastid lipid-associated protein/fibrillin conserved domain-containing protein n=1 Tax=Chlamydomonas incerta TaxID=51695 RepID=A0A835WCI0_CHLIN|nr:hypothetical protein HXX76_001650 [Chlamydomonas incerta]|eukprot:KAG2444914.1 hypothetical protein HXX76_001650 [Chlamydomonas incerta]